MSKANVFNSVAVPNVDSNNFDLSHDVKMSFEMGYLVPTAVIETMPGDVFNISVENMLRFAPLISPVMHKVKVTTHAFFVPNRLLWPGWEDFITGNSDNPAPYVFIDQVDKKTIADYLGLPVFANPYSVKVSPLSLAAYYKIYDEYYRDQNLQPTETFIPLVDGDNSANYSTRFGEPPKRRAWQHDYFTSALPWAQKGDAVQIPLVFADNIPVDYTNNGLPVSLMNASTGAIVSTPGDVLNNTGPSPLASSMGVSTTPVAIDPNGTLTVDVQAEATDINTLRRAFALQEWLERNARAGTRYNESIWAHFKTRTSDSRLQRPEYIGGTKQNMIISEVLATAQTDGATSAAVGQMAGHGISVGGGNRFSYKCEEHGHIIMIINVQPDTAYQNGLHRMFTRFDRFDYPWPIFANIGEQPIYNKELYVQQPDGADLEEVFGYVPRYSDFKFLNSRVAGEMRDTLSFWHLGRIFDTPPALNSDFIECAPSTRIFAVTSDADDHIYSHIFNNIYVRRKLPRYGIPTI